MLKTFIETKICDFFMRTINEICNIYRDQKRI